MVEKGSGRAGLEVTDLTEVLKEQNKNFGSANFSSAIQRFYLASGCPPRGCVSS